MRFEQTLIILSIAFRHDLPLLLRGGRSRTPCTNDADCDNGRVCDDDGFCTLPRSNNTNSAVGNNSSTNNSSVNNATNNSSSNNSSVNNSSVNNSSLNNNTANNSSVNNATNNSSVNNQNECPPGLVMCSDGCVDLSSDPGNCGSCGRSCPNGQYCEDSDCMGGGGDCTETPCTGFTYCNLSLGQCLPGCGSDNQCDQNETCDPDHTCVCDSDYHSCDGQCVDSADPAHCGERCEPCPTETPLCAFNQCTPDIGTTCDVDCSDFPHSHCETDDAGEPGCYCDDGYLYDSASDECIPAADCVDDEIGNDFENATPLIPPHDAQHKICPGKNDVFSLQLEEGQTLTVTLDDFDTAAHDLDIYLTSAPLESATVAESNGYEFESFDYAVESTGSYYLLVVPYSHSDITYHLEVGLN